MTTSRRALLSGFLAMPLVPLAGAIAFGQEAPLLPLPDLLGWTAPERHRNVPE
ncbi:hypothetical protein N2599_22355 (plasmid) [Rhizobium sullae]|uniref:Uncharacterized protein n=1 Tax=Rhizobium sullae TaxID=50338 RepID=A0ABY5XUP4_RHISU|nr:hypothetical protein [Rhizobium sullae]UWU18037.1 hypothetical protein N2599_22355 [Rhizobium sullae]